MQISPTKTLVPFCAPSLTAWQARQPMRRHAPRPGRSSTTEASSTWHPDDDDASRHPRRRRLGPLVPAPLVGSGTLGPLRWSAPCDSGTRHDAGGPQQKKASWEIFRQTRAALMTCRKPQEQGFRHAFRRPSAASPRDFRETAATMQRKAHNSRITAENRPPLETGTSTAQHSTAQQPQRR